MQAKLTVVRGKATRSAVNLKLPMVVGRTKDADLIIEHPTISRRHCELFEKDGVLVVRDFGSLNGTLIDDQRVKIEVLKPGAVLTVGPLSFRADYEFDGEFPDLGSNSLDSGTVEFAPAPSPEGRGGEQSLPVADVDSGRDDGQQSLSSPAPDSTAVSAESGEDDALEFDFLADVDPQEDAPEDDPPADFTLADEPIEDEPDFADEPELATSAEADFVLSEEPAESTVVEELDADDKDEAAGELGFLTDSPADDQQPAVSVDFDEPGDQAAAVEIGKRDAAEDLNFEALVLDEFEDDSVESTFASEAESGDQERLAIADEEPVDRASADRASADREATDRASADDELPSLDLDAVAEDPDLPDDGPTFAPDVDGDENNERLESTDDLLDDLPLDIDDVAADGQAEAGSVELIVKKKSAPRPVNSITIVSEAPADAVPSEVAPPKQRPRRSWWPFGKRRRGPIEPVAETHTENTSEPSEPEPEIAAEQDALHLRSTEPFDMSEPAGADMTDEHEAPDESTDLRMSSVTATEHDPTNDLLDDTQPPESELTLEEESAAAEPSSTLSFDLEMDGDAVLDLPSEEEPPAVEPQAIDGLAEPNETDNVDSPQLETAEAAQLQFPVIAEENDEPDVAAAVDQVTPVEQELDVDSGFVDEEAPADTADQDADDEIAAFLSAADSDAGEPARKSTSTSRATSSKEAAELDDFLNELGL